MSSQMSSSLEQSRAGEVYGATITLTIVASLAVTLRFVSRKISQAPYWWDDWAIVAALVSARWLRLFERTILIGDQILDYGLTTCYWLMTRKYGLGHHSSEVGGPVHQDTVVSFFKVSKEGIKSRRRQKMG